MNAPLSSLEAEVLSLKVLLNLLLSSPITPEFTLGYIFNIADESVNSFSDQCSAEEMALIRASIARTKEFVSTTRKALKEEGGPFFNWGHENGG